jgi:hypothetical protein
MVYSFFEKWKTMKSESFSIHKEILFAEQQYKLKIMLFKKIWSGLHDRKFFVDDIQKLLNMYTRELKIYSVISSKLEKLVPSSLEITNEDFNSFCNLIHTLLSVETEERALSFSLLSELRKGNLPNRFESSFFELQSLFSIESDYFSIEDKDFKEVESFFLGNKDPGAGTGGYVKITDLVKKGRIFLNGNKLFVDGKVIQGLIVEGNTIILKGDHLTNKNSAESILSDAFVNPSFEDPFSYFIEKGKFNNWKRKEIQYNLGISNAEACVSFELQINPEQVFVKIKEGKPLQFAIRNLHTGVIRNVDKNIKYIAA